jgi:nucleoid-associated protein YgaU
MGIFDFFKKAGTKVFKNEELENAKAEEAHARKIQLLENIVENVGYEIENLKVELNNDVIVIHGSANNQAEKEKVILALGNVDGISAVDDRLTVEEQIPTSTFYTVKSGDTLSKIAKAQYGNAMKYMEIFEANQPMLSDPNKIYPGQVLRIPPLA